MALGKIDSIFRYPVKSMMGEKIEETCVTSNGVLGDRVWACAMRCAAASEVPRRFRS